MVVKFDPKQVSFSSVPSLSTAAQDQAAQLFGQVGNTMNQLVGQIKQKEREQEAERQQEIVAQANEAASDALNFANKSYAAQTSSDFNKAAQQIIQANAGDPIAISEQLSAFAKGQAKSLAGSINPDDYVALVQPKIEAFAAQAQKQSNQQFKVQSEQELQEAVSLKQEEILSLDFSVAQSELAIQVGVAEYEKLVSGLDIPEAQKRMNVDKFKKSLSRKAIIDNYENSDDKDGFIASVSESDIAGFAADEKADLVNTLRTINNAEKAAAELGQAEAKAQQKEAAANLHADLRITANNPASTPADLLDVLKKAEQYRADGTFEPQQAANLIIEVNNKLKGATDMANSMSNVAAALNGESAGLDPKDKGNIAAVDMAAQKIQNSGQDVNTVNTKLVNLASSTGIVPDVVKQKFRIAARTNDPNTAQEAAEIFSRLEEEAPNIIGDIPEKDVAFFSEMTELMRAGMTQQEAFERAKEYTDPLNSAVQQAREKEVQDGKLLKNSASDVADIFDPSIFTRGASLSVGSVEETVVRDYEEAFKAFYRHKPDADFAKKQAERVIKRKWDVTNVDGRKRVMAYPPERFYSISGMDNGWMQEDFRQSLSEFKDKDLSEAFLVPDPMTAREALSTGEPAYRVMYVDQKDGMIKPLVDSDEQPLLWRPDKKSALEKRNKEKIKKAQIKRAVTADTEAGLREALGGVAEDRL